MLERVLTDVYEVLAVPVKLGAESGRIELVA
jgi:hypothetical protein